MVLEAHTSDGLAPTMWQKNYSYTHRRNSGGVCGQVLSTEGHSLHNCEAWFRRTHTGTQELLLYTGVCSILICRKFTNTVSKILQVALSIETQWCGKTQISICPQKLQHLDQYLMKPGHLDKIYYQGTDLF